MNMKIKVTKIFAAMLAVLGFAACEPEEPEVKSTGCPPDNVARPMYGALPCTFEVKDNVPDAKEIAEFELDGTEIFIQEDESE